MDVEMAREILQCHPIWISHVYNKIFPKEGESGSSTWFYLKQVTITRALKRKAMYL